WIYTGSYPDSGNLMKRRGGIQDPKTNDPTGMGFYPNWSWSWPLNRRVMYNRASADLDGKAWDPSRPGITWDGSKWVGDVPDYPATMNPHDPNAYLTFIKSGDRVRVSSKRGKVEVLALVTKRLGPMTVAGQKVYQIGIPIHWGYVGISADSDPSHGRYWLANALTPFVGDANARTPEFKAFLVNLEKM